ncbi:methyl-accepting chemotaxis protein [Halalkalibacter urbisdiaboli]|uniref:methyl-accepting chemotaxis protein n=1 Tax=Halalkalibacter urbisdiaboli TaxID=1960589 RepID=UPI000B43581A|nr:methyl-accepting chemotaxis protein [Halalkalibacter urbisdiaboli]
MKTMLKKFTQSFRNKKKDKPPKTDKRKRVQKQKRELSFMKGSKIGKKLLLMFLLFSIIPVVIIASVSYQVSSSIISEKTSEVTEELIVQVSKNFESKVGELANLSLSIVTSREIYDGLDGLDSAETDFDVFTLKRELQETLAHLVNTRKDIAGISIITDDNIFKTQTSFDIQSPEVQEMIQKVKDARGRSIFFTMDKETSTNDNIVLGRMINSISSGQELGVLLIEANDNLHETIKGISLGETGYVSIINYQGDLISRSREFSEGESENAQYIEDLISMELPDSTTFISENNELITAKLLDGTGWILSSNVPISELTTETKEIAKISIIIGVITVVVSFVVAIFVSNGMTGAIRRVTNMMQEVEVGNLAVVHELGHNKKQRKDEIGELMKSVAKMVEGIRALIVSASSTAEVVSTSSNKLSENSAYNKQLATHTQEIINEVTKLAQETAASTEESVEAIESITTDIQKIAEVSSDVSNNSVHMIDEAKQGQEYITDAVQQIGQVNKIVNESADMIQELDDHASQIVKVTEIISSLSEQTNLLALNAAIEAARAGEKGLGFAVVADEVRKLSQQSQKATEEIGALITKIQKSTKVTVDKIVTGKHEVTEGNKRVEDAGKKFNELVGLIESVANQVQGVSSIIQQVSASSEEVSATVHTMSSNAHKSTEMTQRVQSDINKQLDSIDQASKSSEELEAVSNDLMKDIRVFKI